MNKVDSKTVPKIGIIGGGQLGCMFLQEAARYDVSIYTLDSKNSPAYTLSTKHIIGSINSFDDILKLGETTDVISIEIEHVNIEALYTLEKQGKIIIPQPRVLDIIKNKAVQKDFYQSNGIHTVPYRNIENIDELDNALNELDIHGVYVLKLATGGYDGKGVFILNRNQSYDHILNSLTGPFVVEKYIEDTIELSVISACDQQGNIQTFPIVEMVFDPQLNLVDELICPSNISKDIIEEANNLAIRLTKSFNSAGIFAIEMLLDKNGKIYVNETAPRAHNSGHHTIEACYTSQYEQLLRILAGWPLGSTELIKPCAMINIIGPHDINGTYQIKGINNLLNYKGVYIHMYGKETTKPGRKLGHIIIMDDHIDLVLEKVKKVKELYQIIPS